VRYDPWDWITYKNSNFVSSIAEGQEYIYFGTNGGVVRYHIFGKFWDFPITRSQGLPDDEITAVYYDLQTDILWAASETTLSLSMDGGRLWHTTTKEELGLRPAERIIRLGSTSIDVLCVTTSQILRIDRLSGFVISPYAQIPQEDVNWGSRPQTGAGRVESVLNDFTATQGWVNDLGIFHGPGFQEAAVSTMLVDRFGDIWVGTWGGPIFYGNFQMRLLEPLEYGPTQTNAETILPSADGLWTAGVAAGSDRSGITLYDPRRGIWDYYRDGTEIMFGEADVLCAVLVEQEWWFGTTSGIQVFTPEKDSWFLISEAKGLPDIHVTRIAYDGQYVYAGTPSGIVRIQPLTRKRVPWELAGAFRNLPVRELHWDGDYLWLSSSFDLWRWQSSAGESRRLALTNSRLPGLTEKETGLLSPVSAIASSDRMVYFGDEFGLLSYDKITGKWSRFSGKAGLVGFEILSLALSGNPSSDDVIIWMGTTKGVIAFNSATGYVRHFTEKDGLSSDRVRTVIIDGKTAWFGTPEGLVRFQWEEYLK
jgi:ligand-binding sensor domain-containing protein|tara:strand:+ start:14046 stop:15653 length:1608 start_codon:yes stop_codon:yes gene_type:complete